MVDTAKPLVLITGVNGFLGSQVLNEYLNGEGKGQFRIRATVRDINSKEKMGPLESYFGTDLRTKVEFVNADLNNQDQIEAAVKGCDFVIHTASPVGKNPKNHADMINPAVNGVLFVVTAAQKHGVKRVVITSSVAACSVMHNIDCPDTFDESNWSDLNSAAKNLAYIKSKTLAEKAAWNFKTQMENEGKPCPEIVTILPTILFGEFIGAGAETSTAVVRDMINNKIPMYPDIQMQWVDVKDVALAHFRAMVRPKAANQRIILSDVGSEQFIKIADQLQDVLTQNGYDYKLNRTSLSNCCLYVLSIFSSELAALYSMTGRPPRQFNNTKSKEILGIEYKRKLPELLLATAEALIQAGQLELKKKKD